MVKIAAVQVAASEDTSRTLRKVAQYLEAAAAKGVNIACLPELFARSWFPATKDEANFSLAEGPDGQVAGEVSGLAKKLGVSIICPLFEADQSGKFYNSVYAFDSKGNIAGHYRKAHLPSLPFWEEKFYFSPGDKGFPVFDLEGVKVGVQLGWDNFFPEGFRALGLKGAEVVFLPSAAAFASQERWLAMCVAHAFANGYYLMRVNRVGTEEGLDFYGNSFCIRPDGDLAAEPLGLGEGILLVDCDISLVAETKELWPFMGDRRPYEYTALSNSENCAETGE